MKEQLFVGDSVDFAEDYKEWSFIVYEDLPNGPYKIGSFEENSYNDDDTLVTLKDKNGELIINEETEIPYIFALSHLKKVTDQ